MNLATEFALPPITLAYTGMPLPDQVASKLPAATAANPHFRIPALCVTSSGRMLAAFDIRPSFHDFPGELSIGYRYSDDGGANWSGINLLVAGGEGWGHGDASLISLADGRIICAYVASRGLSFWDDAFADGYSSEAITAGSTLAIRDSKSASEECHWELRMAISDDDGYSWHHACVTEELLTSHRNIANIFFSSGQGIQLQIGTHRGRVLAPITYREHGSSHPCAAVAISDDGGAHWQLHPAITGGDEAKVAQAPNGDIYMSTRAYPHRLLAKSSDGGVTWSKPQLSVPDPGCNGGFCYWNGKATLTNLQPQLAPAPADPASEDSTKAKNIGASTFDPSQGRSTADLQDWDARRNLCLLTGPNPEQLAVTATLDPGSAAYSVALPLPNGQLALLWERENYHEICFASIA